MSTIEDILYEAHKLGKRELLLENLLETQQQNPNMSLINLYQMTFDQLNKL
ncbi:hypothetical protein Q4Q35_13580 [Flavivirga aquimarina]|uniref:Uncharacterized protein n=1 Tax=Flavivirga aquimarina TaxID=2027862 RepID=A0ABT8WCG8_9FLAO|nr:hypothetical protein [Flavivirga aquimarina]MDO5970840.1 hypothetical protein [Flavivirga aquimarina]